MRERPLLCPGIFAVMALSNVIVPLLPSYSEAASVQGTVYAAYFLGAFLITLPAGILADRHGRIVVMQAGLILTVISGALLAVLSDPVPLIGARFIEGLGAGLFVAGSMASVNSHPDHRVMSGYYLASLNAGLVSGLLIGGFLAQGTGLLPAGILALTTACFVTFLVSLGVQEAPVLLNDDDIGREFILLVRELPLLLYSVLVLTGLTGALISLYPEFSDALPGSVASWIAGMSIATILASLFFSRTTLPPVVTIRIAALVMAAGTALAFFTPAAFVVVGGAAGVAMVAQMAFLAATGRRQGIAMGLYSTAGYLGMSILPVLAGGIADLTGFLWAFLLFACLALSVALVIGRCSCRIDESTPR